MSQLGRMTRRAFLISGALVGGGMAVAAGWVWRRNVEGDRYMLPASKDEYAFGAWLKISEAGLVTVAVPRQEMGQGVYTTLPMLVAEELEADPAQVRFEQAPIEIPFANTTVMLDGLPVDAQTAIGSAVFWTMGKVLRALGLGATGGSTSVRDGYVAMRQAGAAAKASLLSEAAARWQCPIAEVSIENGVCQHSISGRRFGIGELAQTAGRQPLESQPRLKPQEAFKLLGRSQSRLDVPEKTNGTAVFGLDVRLPELRYAAIRQAPALGARLKAARFKEGFDAKGLSLISLDDAYVVVGDRWWRANRALDQVEAEWSPGESDFSSDKLFERFSAAIDEDDARVWLDQGQADQVLASASRRIDAEYQVPFVAHATLEPPNATVWVKEREGGKLACEVWAGHQAPLLVQWTVSKLVECPLDAVTVHVPFLGGGFGRRTEVDFIEQAAEVALRLKGRPVQLIWSREEDIKHDAYRPAAMARMSAALSPASDHEAGILALSQRLASPSVMASFIKRNTGFSTAGPDRSNVDGAINHPYGIAVQKLSHATIEQPAPVGFWRSVGHSQNAFFLECFMDECAVELGLDPYHFRQRLLSAEPKHGKRFKTVLDRVAEMSGWTASKPHPAGSGAAAAAGSAQAASQPTESGTLKRGKGIAIAESFKSIVAEVVEVEVSESGQINVTKVWAAVDCGLALDPAIVQAQIASGIVFGLSAALYGEIEFKAGQVVQSNLNDYPLLGFSQAPRIEVAIINSGEALGGIGEVGTPPAAPALANAIYAATGKRLRSLPLRIEN